MKSPRANAILGKMFEKFGHRRREFEFFSRASVEFGLYLLYESSCNCGEISAFRDVLTYKLVCVFYKPLLP